MKPLDNLDEVMKKQAKKNEELFQEIQACIRKDREMLDKVIACLQADNDRLIAFLEKVNKESADRIQALFDSVGSNVSKT